MLREISSLLRYFFVKTKMSNNILNNICFYHIFIAVASAVAKDVFPSIIAPKGQMNYLASHVPFEGPQYTTFP